MANYGQRFLNNSIYQEIGGDIFKYHGYGIIVGIFVVTLVIYIGVHIIYWNNFLYRHFKGRQRLEFWWTVLPIILLASLWYPSIKNLYHIDCIKKPLWRFKAIASQWYWSYEFNLKDNKIFEFQSYMLPNVGEEDTKGYRLLDVDWRIIAPANTQMTIYVRRTDVLHSFALPAAFVKADAIPGRINQIPLKVNQCCIVYGQCSEICGVNHSFIPIVIEFIPLDYFVQCLKALDRVYE